jgi:hypothetical protein
MTKLAIAFTLVSALSPASAYAQQCLHGPNETAEQTARRREALTATRTINNIQHNQPAAREKQFIRHAQLADSPYAASMKAKPNELTKRISFSPDGEILPGWKLTLDVSADGYWFSIKDTTDPCGFAYISNTSGLIYTAEPIR